MNVSATPRDIVYQALRFEQPEICPYYVWVDKEMVPPLAEHYGVESFFPMNNDIWSFAGSYSTMAQITALPVSDDGDRFIDEYGVQYRRGAALAVQRPALSGPSLAGYEFPDLTTDEHFKGLDEWLDTHAERFKIVLLGMLFFECAWGMRGMENILMDFHLNPNFAEDLLEGLEAVCMRVIDRLLNDYGDRIDAIGLSDDYGAQKSMLIHPDQWRKFIKPHLARMCEKIRNGGKQVYLHSCGHVVPIIAELIDVGVNILQPIQPEAMDIFELKRKFGKDLCLMGGISTQHTLAQGTAEDVRSEVRQCLASMSPGGGYVMAPAKPILPGVPLENAIALIDAFVDQNTWS